MLSIAIMFMSMYSGSYAISDTTKFPKKVVGKGLPKTVFQHRLQVKNTINQLISFSKKSSSEIRSEIKRNTARKDKRININNINDAFNIADNFGNYVLFLKEAKASLKNNYQNIDIIKQNITDRTQELMLDLKDATNRQLDAIRMLMQHQQDTLNAIIKNI
jgi:hypothetical protein